MGDNSCQAAKQCLRYNTPKHSVCFRTVWKNSSNKHNVLSNTNREEVSELTNVNKESTETKVEVSVQAKVGKYSTETSSSDNESHKPYTKSFEINQQGFAQKKQVYHDLEAQEDSVKLL